MWDWSQNPLTKAIWQSGERVCVSRVLACSRRIRIRYARGVKPKLPLKRREK